MYFLLLRSAMLALLTLVCVACETPPLSRDPLSKNYSLTKNLSQDTEIASWAKQNLAQSDELAKSKMSAEALDWEKLSRTQVEQVDDKNSISDDGVGLLAQRIAINATALPLNLLLDGLTEQLSLSWQSTEPLNDLVSWNLPEQSATSVLDQLAERFTAEGLNL